MLFTLNASRISIAGDFCSWFWLFRQNEVAPAHLSCACTSATAVPCHNKVYRCSRFLHSAHRYPSLGLPHPPLATRPFSILHLSMQPLSRPSSYPPFPFQTIPIVKMQSLEKAFSHKLRNKVGGGGGGGAFTYIVSVLAPSVAETKKKKKQSKAAGQNVCGEFLLGHLWLSSEPTYSQPWFLRRRLAPVALTLFESILRKVIKSVSLMSTPIKKTSELSQD